MILSCSAFFLQPLKAVQVLSRLIYLFGVVAFNTVQVISRRVVRRAEETSTYSRSRFCTVNCQPTASTYQLSHLRSGQEPNPDLRGGRRERYHSATVAPGVWARWAQRKLLSGLYLRNCAKRCRYLVGALVWRCMYATSWCSLDLTLL